MIGIAVAGGVHDGTIVHGSATDAHRIFFAEWRETAPEALRDGSNVSNTRA